MFSIASPSLSPTARRSAVGIAVAAALLLPSAFAGVAYAAAEPDCDLVTTTPTLPLEAHIGDVLTVGLPAGCDPSLYTFKWLINGGIELKDGADRTLTLDRGFLSSKIQVEVTVLKTGSIVSTNSVGPVTGKPTIIDAGTARVGTILSVDPGDWGSTTAFTYQWLRGGAPIDGATGPTYTPVGADAGKTLSVRLTGILNGSAASATSAATKAVAKGVLKAPVPTLATTRVGLKVTATRGTWTAGTTFKYQWFLDGKSISGATSAAYTPKATDLSKTLTVRVTGSKDGYTSVAKTSAGKKVAVGQFTAPAPKVTGTLRVGSTVTVAKGTWSPAPARWAYQWYAAGQPIKGATGTSFKITEAQRGKTLSVRVTGAKDSYQSKAVTSAKTALVTQTFKKSPTPTISGTVQVGSTLTAKPGTWAPAASFSYQWLRGSTPISGATKSTYKLVAADQGKTIKVTVVARANGGWVTTTRTSAATMAVRK